MSLECWDKFKQPPDWAMGKIGGGKLSGKTDINPQWRIQVMTETFGPVGIGWKFVETARQIVDGATGEKMVFVDLDLFVNIGGKWSAPIPGRGGDMLVETEKGKLVSNDEAVKMATTDALGNAMKYLGVAATVYSKGIDGTKYGRKSVEPQQGNTNTLASRNTPAPANPVTKPEDLKYKINLGTKEIPNYKMLTLAEVPDSGLPQIEWYAKHSNNEVLKAAANDFILSNAERFVGEQKTASTGS